MSDPIIHIVYQNHCNLEKSLKVPFRIPRIDHLNRAANFSAKTIKRTRRQR